MNITAVIVVVHKGKLPSSNLQSITTDYFGEHRNLYVYKYTMLGKGLFKSH